MCVCMLIGKPIYMYIYIYSGGLLELSRTKLRERSLHKRKKRNSQSALIKNSQKSNKREIRST